MKSYHLPSLNINRLVDLQSLSLTPSEEDCIDLYNQGIPAKDWDIDPKVLKRNDFKIFSTGDAFAIISPEVEVKGANIQIHVGLKHASYTPSVLLHEALQLCRCAYEHGAESITVSLPEELHPAVYANDFNRILMNLFKASGASKLFFYDKNYKGKLNKDIIDSTIAPLLSEPKSSAPETKKSDIKRQPHVLLSCSANKTLADKIASELFSRGEAVKLYHLEGRGEQATIPREASICGAEVTIVQSTRPSPDDVKESQHYEKNGATPYFMEVIKIADEARLKGAVKINLINPYQFSARSDKAEDNSKGKTGAYVQQNGMLLEAAGVNKVITAECHDAHTLSGSYTRLNMRGYAVNALTTISSQIAKDWKNAAERPAKAQLRLVAPDAGAVKRTATLTQELQSILGKLCGTRISGEKERASHKDDSACISAFNLEDAINPADGYLITDDETATGNTLCQSIRKLKDSGAQHIIVVVVHNNMPLEWLQRQLCLARFLFLGANSLHFSDTQEMGTLAKDYANLIEIYAQRSQLSPNEIAVQIKEWFKKNLKDNLTGKNDIQIEQEFNKFKAMFSQLESRINIHSLASEFVNELKPGKKVLHQVLPFKGAPTLFQSQPKKPVNTESVHLVKNALS